jgi:hypothetical protein
MTSLGDCTNCGSPLQGRYCSQCGQKTESGRPTFGHFFGETIESLTHADSRLWKTLWLLLSKPGLLTKEFFEGKRSRYLPPIRLYIVLSVAFFLLLALWPDRAVEVDRGDIVNVDMDCKSIHYDGPFSYLIRDQLQHTCERLKEAGGSEALGKAFLANIPKAMWVLLPLFAVFMLLFWWKPRRLYAEHVLFLIHNHSAVFAMLAINMIFDGIAPEFLRGLLGILIPVYLLWYTWRGIRVFYGDSRGLTVLKLSSLTILYLFCAALVLTLTGLASALTF